jgi:hypothetical protein
VRPVRSYRSQWLGERHTRRSNGRQQASERTDQDGRADAARPRLAAITTARFFELAYTAVAATTRVLFVEHEPYLAEAFSGPKNAAGLSCGRGMCTRSLSRNGWRCRCR